MEIPSAGAFCYEDSILINALRREIVRLSSEKTTNEWKGTPIYRNPSHMYNALQSRVFSAVTPGRIIATFHGLNHAKNAEIFCELFGVEDQSEKMESNIP